MSTAKKATSPKYVMLNDMVLVKRIDDEIPDDGIERPEIAKQRSNKGEVIAVPVTIGSGNPQLINIFPLKVGDTVLFSEHASGDVELDGVEYVLCNIRQIYMKLA